MRIDQLKYLVHLYDSHSITQTANYFYISQQALSEMIAKFEKELEQPVLKRSRQGVTFTSFGETVYQFAKETTNHYQKLIDESFFLRHSNLSILEGTLHCTVHARLYRLLVFHIVQQFSRYCPKIRLEIIESVSTKEMTESVRSDDVICGLTTIAEDSLDGISPFFDDLLVVTLARNQMVACMSASHPLSVKKSIPASALNHESIIAYDIDTVKASDFAKDSLYNRPQIYTSADIDAHKRLIQEHHVIEVMGNNEYALFYRDDHFKCVPINDTYMHIVFFAKKEHESNPLLELLQKVTSDVLNGSP